MSYYKEDMRKEAKKNSIIRKWYFFDVKGKTLGRIAVEISQQLRGRSSLNFDYNKDLGNYVVVINSDKIIVSGNNKLLKKKYYNHSGYPGGLRERTLKIMIEKYSTELIHRIVKGLMPHNKLSKKQQTRLFVYSDENHPHNAQKGFLII
jgi:large subunit ribosomal protein L13